MLGSGFSCSTCQLGSHNERKLFRLVEFLRVGGEVEREDSAQLISRNQFESSRVEFSSGFRFNSLPI